MENNTKFIITAILLGGLILVFSQNIKKGDKEEVVKEPVASFLNFDQIADKIVLGKKDAPLTAVEYSNFLCSHCANFALNTFPQLEEKYIKTGQIKWIIIITPPMEASLSAYCANEQDKFIDYHNYVFQHQTEITKADDLKDMAVKAGLDGNAFNQCIESKKYENIIDDLLDDGDKRGVDGTPTFFIGKSNEFDQAEKIVGNQPFEQFENIIKQYQ